eukprot:TRINITY_DN2724_c3_g1_i1.p1 TRINITY_DN2724_c3_g1~~TRINITY_DN2724_c3_g1_i1.p1  ORF type:complete len:1407 (-),score=310.13 TRINITY_DN2724_c3_g1_i1:5409-9629(-)
MEEDMKKMHERHVKLMKEVDENYKLIEEETQDHFTEFLDKWKKLAKSKIDQYKAAFNSLKTEKEDIQTRLQAIVTDLQEKNKKLVEDYEKLLEKYHRDLEAGKKQHKEKVELMESTYEEELSKLKQEKIELEGLLEAMKSQKETYEQKAQELRKKMKEKMIEGQETMEAIVENYRTDCAALVVQGIVDAVEAKDNQIMSEGMTRGYRKEIEMLRQNVTRLEREKEILRDQVKRTSTVNVLDPKGKKVVKLAGAPGEELGAAVLISGDTKRYDALVMEKGKVIRKIHAWKADFEKREGRKCEKADCEPIRGLYRELKKINEQIMELRGQKPDEAPGINDSIVSLGSDAGGNRSRSMSPRSKGKHTALGDRSFTNAMGSLAEVEELKQENRNLKDEMQNLRLAMAGSVGETEVVKQLKDEIEGLKKDKEQWRIKYQELAAKAGRDALQNKDISGDLDQLRRENTKLQEKLLYLKNRSQTMAGLIGEQKADDTYKIEFEKMLVENQEQQKTIQKLEPLQVKVVELEAKLQSKEKEFSGLREKYEKVGLERVSLGKQLLKMKELEAERMKIRNEIINDSSKPGQDQVLKELAKENETIKAQLAKQEEEFKSTQDKVNKLTRENEELLEKLATLKQFENDSKELLMAQQKLADAEREIGQLRVQMAMGLPEAPEDRNTLIKGDYDKVLADNKTLKDKFELVQKRLASLKDIKKNYDEKANEAFQLRQELKRLQIENEEISRKAELVNDCKAKIADLRMQLADKVPREPSNIRQELRKVVEENKELQSNSDDIENLRKNYLQYKASTENTMIELGKLRQELRKIELERDGLKTKADKATSYMMERNSLRVQLAKLSKADDIGIPTSGETAAMKAEMTRLLAENEKLLKNVEVTERVKKENLVKDERIKELEAKLKAGKERIKELEQLLSKNNESKTKEILDKFKNDMRDLEKQLEKERQANKALKLEVDKTTKKYDQLREKDVRDLEDKIRRLEAQHKQDITLFEKASAEEIGKRGKELENAKAEIIRLTETNAALTTSKTDLEGKVKVLSQNVQRLEADLAKIGAEASRAITLQEKVETLSAQIEKERSDYVIMEKKYKDEMLQRKRLHNIIEDMKGKIRVYCRVRPLSQKEIEMGSAPIVNIMDEFTVKVDTKYGPKAFSFDAAFGPDTSQDKVFEDTKRLVQSAVDGYNVCIFAYGQTGAGKTFTIQGSDSDPGIAPRSFEEMERILFAMSNYGYSMECYMVELYLDTLSDLLLPKDQRKNPPHLDIKEDMKGMVFIQGVTKHQIKGAEEAKKIFELGLNNRKTSATQMNDNSSRSHLIFSILIETVNRQTTQRTVGKISFVDLAGSERATKAGTSTERLKEGRAINKSLSALGDVISILSSGGTSLSINNPLQPKDMSHTETISQLCQ